MNWARAITVAKKDLAEFRKNRYIMISILVMPIVISVILPSIYVLPIKALGAQNSDKVTLNLHTTASFSGITVTDSVMYNASLSYSNITNCVLIGCIVSNSTIVSSRLNGSVIDNSTARSTLMTNCNLINFVDSGNNNILDSQYIGGNKELENLKNILFDVLLILLIMIPVTIPTVTASYSFVGEKINRSLEPMLATPISDLELLVGKSGSIFAVSMIATWASFVISVFMVDVLTEPTLGYYPLPNAYWVIGIIALAPGMCLMSILFNVLISSRVNDVRVSQQIGSVLILPVLLFFFFSLTGFLSSGIASMVMFSLIILAADAGILWLSLRVFNREEILVSWK